MSVPVDSHTTGGKYHWGLQPGLPSFYTEITCICGLAGLFVFSSTLSVSFLGFLISAIGSSITGGQHTCVGGLVGLAVGLQVDVGLSGVFTAVATVWTAFPLLRLSARSRLEHVDKAAVKPWILWILSLIKSQLNVGWTDLSSSVRPRSWLRLRLIGYTLGTRVRSLVICLNLSSLRRWDWPGWQSDKGDCE